jgi:hypothetical protein
VRRANQDSKAARVGAPLSLILGFVGLGSHAKEVEVGSEAGDAEHPGALAAALQDEFHRVSLFAQRYREQGAKALNDLDAG